MHLCRLRDRLSPLPSFHASFPLRDLPEELYGGASSVCRSSRLHFEGFVVSLWLLVFLALPLAFVSGWVRLALALLLAADTALLLTLVRLSPSVPFQVAERRVRRRSRRRPGSVPASFLTRPRLADDLGRYVQVRLVRHLSRHLSAPQHEAASVLAKDGFDGSVDELVALARLLVPDATTGPLARGGPSGAGSAGA